MNWQRPRKRLKPKKMLGGRGEADARRLGRARVGSENRWEYAR
jgi:hypothetical protein